MRKASWSRGRGQRRLPGLVRALCVVEGHRLRAPSGVGLGCLGQGQENCHFMGGGQKKGPWRTMERRARRVDLLGRGGTRG